ncbi:MAG TPA: alpha/beta fold hydrolase [Acidimicrobiales bacterium]|nr:alpha/beta fold hydrolase [Acidimicrobiales bacterium]
MTTYVLVHGIVHGGWCWSPVQERLEQHGHDVVAVDLPLTSLDEDAAEVRRALDAASAPVVLVGHSYGGHVISMAAAGRTDVSHLVYVAAVMLDADDPPGDRFAQFPTSTLLAGDIFTDDGRVIVPPELGVVAFYAECDPEVARAAAERLRPTSLLCLGPPAGAEPWRDVPSTYVLCERDQAIHPDLQRWMSTRAGTVVTFDTDHSPFYSMPDELTEVLRSVAQRP